MQQFTGFSMSTSDKKLAAEACPQGPSPVNEQGVSQTDGNIQITLKNKQFKQNFNGKNVEQKQYSSRFYNPRGKNFKMRGDRTEAEVNEARYRFLTKKDYEKEPCPCGGSREGCRGFVIKRDKDLGRAIEMPKEQESYERFHLVDDYRPPVKCPKGMNPMTFDNVVNRYEKRRKLYLDFNDNQEACLQDMIADFSDECRRDFEQEGKNPDCPNIRKVLKRKIKLFKAKLYALNTRLDVRKLWKGLEVLERDVSVKQPEEYEYNDCMKPWFKRCQQFVDKDGKKRFRPPFMVQNLEMERYPYTPVEDASSQARVDYHEGKTMYFLPFYSPFFRRDTSCCVLRKGNWEHPNELAWSEAAGENIRWMGDPRGNPPMDPSWKRIPWRAQSMRDLGFVRVAGKFLYKPERAIDEDDDGIEEPFGVRIPSHKKVAEEHFDQKIENSMRVYNRIMREIDEHEEKIVEVLQETLQLEQKEEERIPRQITPSSSEENIPIVQSDKEEEEKEEEEEETSQKEKIIPASQKEESDGAELSGCENPQNFEEAVQEDSSCELGSSEGSEPVKPATDETVRRRKRKHTRRKRGVRYQMLTETREAIQEEIQRIEDQLKEVDQVLEDTKSSMTEPSCQINFSEDECECTPPAPEPKPRKRKNIVKLPNSCVDAPGASTSWSKVHNQLRAIFPIIEHEKLEEILQKYNGDIHQAIEECLTLNKELKETEGIKSEPDVSGKKEIPRSRSSSSPQIIEDKSSDELELSYDLREVDQMWKVLSKAQKKFNKEDWDMNLILLSGGKVIHHFFKTNGVAFRPPRFRDFHNNLDLYHFLRQHRTRRYYSRMTDWYYFPVEILDIVFPGNMQANISLQQSQNKDCIYACQAYHQSCQWHEGYLSEELSHHRICLLKAIGFHRESANFWVSLAYQVNHPEFQGDIRRFFNEPVVSKMPLAGAWSREEVPNFEFDTESMEKFICQCGFEAGKEEYDNHVLSCLEEIEPEEKDEANEVRNETPRNSSAFSEWRDFLMQQYREQIDNLLQSLVALYNWTNRRVYRYRRFLINVTSAILNMLFFPRSIVLNIPIILNEILSEMPSANELQANNFCESLRHVISRLHGSDLPRAQSQTTREEDDRVANESFGRSFWEIIKSFLPMTQVDAGLLRARQLRIENSIKSLANLRQVHEFLLSWLKEIWFLIQIYLFGATREELEDAHGLLSTDRVTSWVSKVDQFELEILANGRAFSKSSSMMYDQRLQQEYQDLRQEGLEIEKRLVNIKTPGVQKLHQMVTPRLKKIGDWLNSLKGNLTRVPNMSPPFVIYLVGPPKVGKTLCIDTLVRVLLGAKYPDQAEYDEQYDRFQRSRTTAYFDGYNGQKVYVMDDVFQIRDLEILKQELGDVIDLCSVSKAHLNVAQLENKAGLYFTSEFIILTSNVFPAEHELQNTLAEVEAFNRRIDVLIQVDKRKEPRVGMGFDIEALVFKAMQWKMSTPTTKGSFQAVKDWTNFTGIVEFLIDEMAAKDVRDESLSKPAELPPFFMDTAKMRYKNRKEQGFGRKVGRGELPRAQAGSDIKVEPRCHFCNTDFSVLPVDEAYTALFQHCLALTRPNLDFATRVNHRSIAERIRSELQPIDFHIQPSILDAETVKEVKWLQENETPDMEGSMWNYTDIFNSGNARLIRIYATEARHRISYRTWGETLLSPLSWVQRQYRWLRGETLQSVTVVRNSACSASSAVIQAANEITTLMKTVKGMLWISTIVYVTTLIIQMAYRCIKFGVGCVFSGVKGIYNWFHPDKPEIEGMGGSSSARSNAKKKKMARIEGGCVYCEGVHPSERHVCNVCGERGHSWKKHYCSLCDKHGHLEEDCPDSESFGGSASARSNVKRKKNIRAEVESRTSREDLVKELAQKLPPIEASRDVTASTLIHTVRRNLIVLRNLDTVSRVRGFFLCETIVIVPRHILLGSKDYKNVDLRLSTHNVATYDFKLSQVPHFIDEDKDVLIFTLPNSFQAKPDITHYFIKQEDAEDSFTSGYIVTALDNDFTHLVTDLDKSSYWDPQPLDRVDYKGNADELLTVRGGLTYQCDSQQGDCGSLIIRYDSGANRKILGFHIAGKKGVGYASLITQDYLRELKLKLPLPVVHSEVYYQEEFYPCVEDLDEYFDAEGVSMEVLGRLPENCVPHTAGTSELVESPIFEKLMPSISKPALLKEVNIDGKILDPFQYGLRRLQHPQIIFPQKVVDLAVQGMISSYAKWNFRKNLYGNFGLLSDEEMICGIEGHPWIRPLNMHTSPGYPYQLLGGKSNFIQDGKMTDFLEQVVRQREAMALKGQTKLAIIVDTLKDERLPLKKVEEGRTRIFSNCPLDVNLLFRKYFLKFLCFCMDNHITGEVSVGLNVHSEEWEILFRRLQKRGHHWIGGDYTAWDKRTPLQIALGLLDLVESFYKRFDDYDQSHAVLRRVLIQQTFTGIHLLPKGRKNLLYRVHQTMPSGIPLTAVYNSLLNLCLFRVIYILLAQKQGISLSGAVNDFENHVAVVAYGDDHIARVSSLRFPWFNMVSIQQEMAMYGIGYTAPDKSEVMPKEIEESKLTYLKRSFRIDSGRVNAPLELEHVIDILNWVRAKNEKEKIEAFQSAVRSVYIELTHFDRDTFNTWFKKILRASVEVGIVVDVVTYEDALAARLNLQDDSSWVQF